MRKVELLPTRDCEAGYGPGFDHVIANFDSEFDGWEFLEFLGGSSNEKLSFIVIEL